MEETLLKLAGTLGGFAGVVCFALIYWFGNALKENTKELRGLKDAIQQQNYLEILRLIGLPGSKEAKRELQTELKKIDDSNKETK